MSARIKRASFLRPMIGRSGVTCVPRRSTGCRNQKAGSDYSGGSGRAHWSPSMPKRRRGGYVTRSLDADERVMYTTRLFQPSLLFTMWGCLIFGVLFSLERSPRVGIFLLVIAATIFLRIQSTELAVTNKRLIYKRGLLSRRIDEFSIRQIEGVSVGQEGLFARLFNYGTVYVRGAGVGLVSVKSVRNPLGLRRALTEVRW